MSGPRTKQVGWLWLILAVLLSSLAVTISGIIYTGYVARESNRKWCAALIAVDDAYAQALNNPNITPAARHIGEEYHRLRIDFGC